MRDELVSAQPCPKYQEFQVCRQQFIRYDAKRWTVLTRTSEELLRRETRNASCDFLVPVVNLWVTLLMTKRAWCRYANLSSLLYLPQYRMNSTTSLAPVRLV